MKEFLKESMERFNIMLEELHLPLMKCFVNIAVTWVMFEVGYEVAYRHMYPAIEYVARLMA